MMFYQLLNDSRGLVCLFFLVSSCTINTDTIPRSLNPRSFLGINDSIQQTLELLPIDSLNTQFVLRVENKYQDTIDSYMSHASSSDQVHYKHSRNNCIIEFELKGSSENSAFVTHCNCPELTVSPSALEMRPDNTENGFYR